MLARWGHFVYRHRLFTLFLASLLLLASIGGLVSGGMLKDGYPPGDAARAQQLIQAQLPSAGASFSVIFGSHQITASDPMFRHALQAALAPLRADPRVLSIVTPYDVPAARALESRDGRQALAIVTVKDEPTQAAVYYEALRAAIRSSMLTVTATGDLAITDDFSRILGNDLGRAESFALPASLLLLLLVFGAVLAAFLPLIVGVLAILGGFGGVYVVAHLMNTSQYALNIVTLIGLGVAIDYSLFIVKRFREELNHGHSVEESLARTMATAGRTIIFSGIAVVIALSGLLIFSGTFLVGLGIGGAIAVGFAVLYAVTLLPAILALRGHRINVLRLPLIGTTGRPHNGLWRGLSALLSRRPLLALLVLLPALVVVAAPARDLRLAGADIRALPASAESRQGVETVVRAFPQQDQTEIGLVVRFPTGSPLSAAHVGALYDLSHRIARVRDVLRVESLVDSDRALHRAAYQRLYSGPQSAWPPATQAEVRAHIGAHIAVLTVLTTRYASSNAARTLVQTIRAMRTAGDGTILVTGQTATDIDQIAYITSRAPLALLYVLGMTALILFLLLGSVILPLKAILTTTFSILASWGTLVWIFQQGHLSDRLGFTAAGFLDPSIVVLIGCITFGLSMDYEVLLISRIQEAYARTHNTRQAVREGLEKSGMLISGAAAITIAVFLGFGLADVTIIKSLGIGLAVAVGVDAFLVRQIVVPALLHLLGDRAWWAPRPLRRLHTLLRLGEPALPAAPGAAATMLEGRVA